jgi:hypothetical protein
MNMNTAAAGGQRDSLKRHQLNTVDFRGRHWLSFGGIHARTLARKTQPAHDGDSVSERCHRLQLASRGSGHRRYGCAVDVKRAADLYAQGRSLGEIGAELGVHWSTVSQQLPRP